MPDHKVRSERDHKVPGTIRPNTATSNTTKMLARGAGGVAMAWDIVGKPAVDLYKDPDKVHNDIIDGKVSEHALQNIATVTVQLTLMTPEEKKYIPEAVVDEVNEKRSKAKEAHLRSQMRLMMSAEAHFSNDINFILPIKVEEEKD